MKIKWLNRTLVVLLIILLCTPSLFAAELTTDVEGTAGNTDAMEISNLAGEIPGSPAQTSPNLLLSEGPVMEEVDAGNPDELTPTPGMNNPAGESVEIGVTQTNPESTGTAGEPQQNLIPGEGGEEAPPEDIPDTINMLGVMPASLPMTDAEAAAADKAALDITYAAGDSIDSVTQALILPVAGPNGSAISWASDNTAIIGNDGAVMRPEAGSGNAVVNLTATIIKNLATESKTFTVTVIARESSSAPASASFTAPDTVLVDAVPAGTTVKIYTYIYYQSAESLTQIGEAANTADGTQSLSVILDHAITGRNIYISFIEPGKSESEYLSLNGNSTQAETYITLGGNSGTQNAPLRIEVGSMGSLKAFLWQGNDYVRQYYSILGSNLYYSVNGHQKHLATPYYSGYGIPFGTAAQTQADNNRVENVWLHENGALKLTQTIYYPPNQQYFEKRWKVENLSSDQTFSNLNFIHGGDTYFGGYDASRSYWNDTLRMIYLKNENMSDYGLMGFAGSSLTPADHYFGGYYGTGTEYAGRIGQLPDTADATYLDAGYQLQWDGVELGPGESTEIISYERWTESGFIQVIAPNSQTISRGGTATYQFVIQNFRENEDTFDITAASSNGWQANIVNGNAVTIGSGNTATVSVELSVPANTSAATDMLTLNVESRSNPEISQTSQVISSITGAASYLEATAPASQTVLPGATVDYQFQVQCRLAGGDTINLAVSSSNGWQTSIVGDNPLVVSDESASTVTVRLTVPGTATVVSDVLTLNLTSQSQPQVSATSQVTTTISHPSGGGGGGGSSDSTRPYWSDDSILSTADLTESSLKLTWPAAKDNSNVTKYRVYMNDELVATLEGDVFSYEVSGLNPDTEYQFRIEAGDGSGNWSDIDLAEKFRTGPAAVTEAERHIILTVGSLQALIGSDPYTLDAQPFIVPTCSRTLVPVRFIAEALGAQVEWLEATGQVRITKGSKVIVLTIGSRNVTVDGADNVIDCSPVIMPPGRTFVPVRFISEILGALVKYNEENQQIQITIPAAAK